MIFEYAASVWPPHARTRKPDHGQQARTGVFAKQKWCVAWRRTSVMVLSYSVRDDTLRARLSLMRASRSVRIRRSF